MYKRNIMHLFVVLTLAACSSDNGEFLHHSKKQFNEAKVLDGAVEGNDTRAHIINAFEGKYTSAYAPMFEYTKFSTERIKAPYIMNQETNYNGQKVYGPSVMAEMGNMVEYWLIRATKEHIDQHTLGLNGNPIRMPVEVYPHLYGGVKRQLPSYLDFSDSLSEKKYDELETYLRTNSFRGSDLYDRTIFTNANSMNTRKTLSLYGLHRDTHLSIVQDIQEQLATWAGSDNYVYKISGEVQSRPYDTTFDLIQKIVEASSDNSAANMAKKKTIMNVVVSERNKHIARENRHFVNYYKSHERPPEQLHQEIISSILGTCYPSIHEKVKGREAEFISDYSKRKSKCHYLLNVAGVNMDGMRILSPDNYLKPQIVKTVDVTPDNIDKAMYHYLAMWIEGMKGDYQGVGADDVNRKPVHPHAFQGIISPSNTRFLVNRSENKQYNLALANGRWKPVKTMERRQNMTLMVTNLNNMFGANFGDFGFGAQEDSRGNQIYFNSDTYRSKKEGTLFEHCRPSAERKMMYWNLMRVQLHCSNAFIKRSYGKPRGSKHNAMVTFSAVTDDNYMWAGQRRTSPGLNLYAHIEMKKSAMEETPGAALNRTQYDDHQLGGKSHQRVSKSEIREHFIKNSKWSDFISWTEIEKNTSASPDDSPYKVNGYVFHHGILYRYDLTQLALAWRTNSLAVKGIQL